MMQPDDVGEENQENRNCQSLKRFKIARGVLCESNQVAVHFGMTKGGVEFPPGFNGNGSRVDGLDFLADGRSFAFLGS